MILILKFEYLIYLHWVSVAYTSYLELWYSFTDLIQSQPKAYHLQERNVYTMEIYTNSTAFYFLCQIVDEQYEESSAQCITLPNTDIVVKWLIYIIM